MSFTYNRVTLVGRAAAAPDVRFTPGGQRVAAVNLATDRPASSGAAPITDWHRVVCWDKLAEIVAEHVSKGRLVFVEGAVTYRTWHDQQGQKRTTTEILARELILLDRSPAPTTLESPDRTQAARNAARRDDDRSLPGPTPELKIGALRWLRSNSRCGLIR